MNNWTGDVNWGGLHPEEDAVTYYDFVRFYTAVLCDDCDSFVFVCGC
jgi:hypothetical protein